MGLPPQTLKQIRTALPVDQHRLAAGLARMVQPVLPLISMVRFFWQTGDFASIDEIITEFPEPIETDYGHYDQPRQLLRRFTDQLRMFEDHARAQKMDWKVITETGEPLDPMTAISARVFQEALTIELEEINSLLCAPCHCTLCCTGPDREMSQEYFEIPLTSDETELFAVPRVANRDSRRMRAADEPPLPLHGRPFYHREHPALVHWRTGWSLILPKGSACPNLEAANGRCRLYDRRPRVCRKPQLFAYVLEPVSSAQQTFRLRQSLLAVIDCPYVQALRQEIAAYGAACELKVVFSHNKQ